MEGKRKSGGGKGEEVRGGRRGREEEGEGGGGEREVLEGNEVGCEKGLR